MRTVRLWLMLVLVSAVGGARAHLLGPEAFDPGSPLADHGTVPERVRVMIDRYHLYGDDGLLDQGWALIRPALESDTTDPRTLLAAAWLAQAGHDFDEAQAYLRHMLLLSPDHGEAWLLRASIALVQGDRATAREACRKTMLAVPVVITAACFARVEADRADPETTRSAYRRLVSTLAARAPAQQALMGWLQGVAADLASRAGLDEEAEAHFRQALALTPTVVIRSGYADLLLATAHPEQVMTLIAPDETAPALVLRRVVAGMMLGERPDERIRYIESRFEAWIAAGDMRHAREMALFYLHVAPDPDLAYELAQRNFSRQREPEDRALLCQAAARVGQSVDVRCDDGLARLPMLTAVSSAHGH